MHSIPQDLQHTYKIINRIKLHVIKAICHNLFANPKPLERERGPAFGITIISWDHLGNGWPCFLI